LRIADLDDSSIRNPKSAIYNRQVRNPKSAFRNWIAPAATRRAAVAARSHQSAQSAEDAASETLFFYHLSFASIQSAISSHELHK
jgi:hypothetical protein